MIDDRDVIRDTRKAGFVHFGAIRLRSWTDRDDTCILTQVKEVLVECQQLVIGYRDEEGMDLTFVKVLTEGKRLTAITFLHIYIY
jgi:hypothetical protein